MDPVLANTLYAATDGSGVFKSVDGGETWKGDAGGLPDLMIDALAVGPPPSRILYAGSYGDGVFKSTDAGGDLVAGQPGIAGISGGPGPCWSIRPGRPFSMRRCAAASSEVWTAAPTGRPWGPVGRVWEQPAPVEAGSTPWRWPAPVRSVSLPGPRWACSS